MNKVRRNAYACETKFKGKVDKLKAISGICYSYVCRDPLGMSSGNLFLTLY
jgi:hypothetical protein